MSAELPRERVPTEPGWSNQGPGAPPRSSIWRKGQISVVSSLDVVLLPDGSGEVGPQWHISICTKGKRPKPGHVTAALRAFGMTEAEQDNHHPGIAQHYFLVVDPRRRVTCDCKETEAVIVEPDGYAWSNPRPATGEECRGCEYARGPLGKGRPCSIHGEAQQHAP